MRDVLYYDETELMSMGTDELIIMVNEAESKESLYNTEQLVSKTLINALYGALANKYFPLFNDEMAAAITGNGRYFIRKLANYIEDELQRLLPCEEKYIVYGDTDSVLGSTIIRTNKGEIPIESIYDSSDGFIEIRGEDNFIKHLPRGLTSASVDSDKQLQYNNINYIMKHKVKKRMFRVTCNGDEVTITEDHSLMVIRDGVLVETKPTDLKGSDKLVKII